MLIGGLILSEVKRFMIAAISLGIGIYNIIQLYKQDSIK
jgi:hypothetical protein